jgi:hypothetical protein
MASPFDHETERLAARIRRRVQSIDEHLGAIQRLTAELETLQVKTKAMQRLPEAPADTTAPEEAVVSLAPAEAPTEIAISASELIEAREVPMVIDQPTLTVPPPMPTRTRRTRRRAPPAPPAVAMVPDQPAPTEPPTPPARTRQTRRRAPPAP